MKDTGKNGGAVFGVGDDNGHWLEFMKNLSIIRKTS